MRKKAIEKIPYLRLKKTSKKKAVKCIGVTAIKVIDSQKYLFVEIYENKKEKLEVPVARIVMANKDFATYLPKTDTWTRAKITANSWNFQGFSWDLYAHTVKNETAVKENILNAPEDLERIKKYTKIEKPWQIKEWWEYIRARQDEITCEERILQERRKYERRQQALKEREENTPKLPEKQLLEYADQKIFHREHYLYYKKYGVRVRVACSKCGGVTERRWKPGIGYESQFEPIMEEPRQGHYGICPMCGARGRYMPQGKVKAKHSSTAYVFIGQKYKENGMVIRYVEVEKEWQLGLLCEEKGPVMENACEAISGCEIARAYFEDGKGLQIDYHKHSNYTGKDFWDDCNLLGMAKISIKAAPILPETYTEMEGSILQYSAIKEFANASEDDINLVRYMEWYTKMPQIEMLVKLKLFEIVQYILKYGAEIVKNADANRLDTFLGIRKEHTGLLIRHKGDTEILRVLQAEKRMFKNWTEEQIEHLAEINARFTEAWLTVMDHMGIQQILNLIAKYADAEYGTGCGRASERLKSITETYMDYISMRVQLGYDMSNTVYLAPRNLREAHQKMVEESNKGQGNERIREVNEAYPMIKKRYMHLRKIYFYEDDEFIIRPARNAGEIVMEGRILHHCVGGDNYLKKHNDDITTILFLRMKEDPDVAYITVEIENYSMKLKQWYGAYDKKPDKENIDRWLKRYILKLKCGLIGAAEPVKEENEQLLLALA